MSERRSIAPGLAPMRPGETRPFVIQQWKQVSLRGYFDGLFRELQCLYADCDDGLKFTAFKHQLLSDAKHSPGLRLCLRQALFADDDEVAMILLNNTFLRVSAAVVKTWFEV